MKSNFDVDLIFNTYELTYKKILDSNFIKGVLDQNKFDFKNIFVVINNVKNRQEVENICKKLVSRKVITDYFFVEDYLDEVLEKTGLKKEDIKNLKHYIDWALVSIFISKSEYLLKWDADVNLDKPCNWIEPSIIELNKNPNFIVANPIWDRELKRRERESLYSNEDFLYTQDFSDQIFLVKKTDFIKPIYKFFHIYSLRFPLAEFGSIFEKRVDSYLRCKGKIRVTYRKATYTHPDASGTPYPNRSFYHKILNHLFFVLIATYYFVGFPKKVKNIYKF